MKRLFIPAILPLLLSCAGQDSLVLKQLGKVSIDESQIVLKHAPLQAEIVSDSAIAMLVGAKLCVYNFHTGKLLRHFGETSFNSDSLVRATIGVQQKDSIIIMPKDTLSPESSVRIRSFDYSNHEFLLFVQVSFVYRYRSDEQAREARKALQEKGFDAPQTAIISIDDVAEYFFIVDKNLSIKKILTEGSFVNSKYGTYKLFPPMGFHREADKVYMQVYDQATVFMLPPNEKITQSDSLPMLGAAEIGNNEIAFKKELLNTSSIPGYSHAPSEHTYTQHWFEEIGDTLLVSTEAGIFFLRDGKAYSAQRLLDTNERTWGPFKLCKGRLLYCTFIKGEKQGRSLFKALNMQTGEIESTLPLAHWLFCLQGNELVTIGKDDEHYYFERYAITGD